LQGTAFGHLARQQCQQRRDQMIAPSLLRVAPVPYRPIPANQRLRRIHQYQEFPAVAASNLATCALSGPGKVIEVEAAGVLPPPQLAEGRDCGAGTRVIQGFADNRPIM
jgi:hypothetical protein